LRPSTPFEGERAEIGVIIRHGRRIFLRVDYYVDSGCWRHALFRVLF